MTMSPVELLQDAVFLRRFHGWATIAWLAAAPFICIVLADSVAFLVFVSVYAVVVGHWSSWQASRVEVRAEEINDANPVTP